MKALCSIVITAALSTVCLGQKPSSDSATPKTKLQAFEALTGAVVIKGYSEIGAVAGMGQVSVDAMEFTNASDGKAQYGITIQVKESGRLDREDTSFIDYEEIDSLVAGIDYVKAIKGDVTKLRSFEATYRTKGDFAITVFSGGGKIQAAVSSGRIGRATAFLTPEKLETLRALVLEAKKTIDGVKK